MSARANDSRDNEADAHLEIAGVNATRYVCPKCHAVSHNPHDMLHMYCGRCNLFAEQLRNEPVTTFAHITPTPLTRRDCFSLAALTLMDSPNCPQARLVHGWVRGSFGAGEHIEHAWCEFPAEATYSDGSTGPVLVVVDHAQLDERAVVIPAEDLYAVWQARDLRRFTRAEMIAAALRHGHDGPWPTEESCP